jgi:hypothetical protein
MHSDVGIIVALGIWIPSSNVMHGEFAILLEQTAFLVLEDWIQQQAEHFGIRVQIERQCWVDDVDRVGLAIRRDLLLEDDRSADVRKFRCNDVRGQYLA